MDYALEIMPSCRESINKACKKNPVLKKAITGKINEILRNPTRYKPLRGDRAGEYRVHILKSFVLTYACDIDRRNPCPVGAPNGLQARIFEIRISNKVKEHAGDQDPPFTAVSPLSLHY